MCVVWYMAVEQLRSGYSSRTEKELPVLSRWFPQEAVAAVPAAKYLDLILYSREQIRKENEAMGEDSGSDAPWGIVSIKAQDVGTQPRYHQLFTLA